MAVFAFCHRGLFCHCPFYTVRYVPSLFLADAQHPRTDMIVIVERAVVVAAEQRGIDRILLGNVPERFVTVGIVVDHRLVGKFVLRAFLHRQLGRGRHLAFSSRTF